MKNVKSTEDKKKSLNLHEITVMSRPKDLIFSISKRRNLG